MLETAGYLFSQDPKRIIFMDGRPFSRRYQIDNVLAFADALHQPWRILECACSEDVAWRRLQADGESGDHLARNRDFNLYKEVKIRFETILLPKILIDTCEPLETCVERALAVLH
jgi:hypothetical protein